MEPKNLKKALAGFGGALAIAAGLVTHFEGFNNISHPDPVGNTEVCFGHKTNSITHASDEICLTLLEKDLSDANAVIDKYVTVPLSQNQRGALIDLVYNIGATNFARSTLLKKFNQGHYAGGCKELLRWVYAGGKKFNGLVTRRQAEYSLCMEGVQ